MPQGSDLISGSLGLANGFAFGGSGDSLARRWSSTVQASVLGFCPGSCNVNCGLGSGDSVVLFCSKSEAGF